MAEFICREAILDDLEKEIEAGNVALDEDVLINKGLRIAIRDIKDLKAADVQPVKHGRWISHGCGDYECSNCHNRIYNKVNIHYNHDNDYCGRCGARMEG